jgi:hypothetical protein
MHFGVESALEKKNQKTLDIHGARAGATRAPQSKSFCFFFQKEGLSCCRTHPRAVCAEAQFM